MGAQLSAGNFPGADPNSENPHPANREPSAVTSNRNFWGDLRKPFPREVVGLLPKPYDKNAQKGNCKECGKYHGLPAAHLDYVGHAAVTDRLNSVAGPDNWNWEPLAFDENGLPRVDRAGNLWIKLSVRESPQHEWVTRYGYGDGNSSIKELIGDALRNAAMRFGIALDLWTKEELESAVADPSLKNEKPSIGSAPEPAKPAQIREAVDLMRQLGIPDQDMAQFMTEEYGVREAKKMTQREATRVLQGLHAAFQKEEARQQRLAQDAAAYAEADGNA